MESKEITITLCHKTHENHIKDIRKFHGFIREFEHRHHSIVIKLESLQEFMKLYSLDITNYECANIFIFLLKHNHLELAECFLDTYHSEIASRMCINEFAVLLQQKEIVDFVIRKISMFTWDELIHLICVYSYNDTLFDLYMSMENNCIKDTSLIDRELHYCLSNDNYKILSKILKLMPDKDSIIWTFYVSILYNKLEFSDLLLLCLDTDTDTNIFQIDSPYNYLEEKRFNLHIDAATFIDDITNKKGYNIDKEFIRFYIKRAMEHDKYEIFCYLIEKFPTEALEIGKSKIFNMDNLKYLLKIDELRSSLSNNKSL